MTLLPSAPLASDTGEDATSMHGSCYESDSSGTNRPQAKKKGKRKRKKKISGPNNVDAPTKKCANLGGKVARHKSSENNLGGTKIFTVDGVMSAFPKNTITEFRFKL
jgi:hypothetical protein